MKIHFIGIGGIGVSALAQYYLTQGHEIFGSDLASSEITQMLAKKGVTIFIGNRAGNIKQDLDLIIYSPAVKPDNPELLQAIDYKLRAQSYPEALGQLTLQYNTIAVSGSHGKSTTTAMLALVLIKAGIDPTVIVGTKLKEFSDPDLSEGEGTNFRMGNSKYLVIEACEYDGSFLNYQPKISVITNIDKEHLDYFKTFSNVIKEFKKFIMRLPINGFLVANRDDKILVKISRGTFKTKFYSIKNKESEKIKKILKIPGKHNISNALAVLQVARILGIKDSITFGALTEFKGTWRRFEIFEKNWGDKVFTLISDYGHHPTEVKATLKAVREKYKKSKIWCIFQPHQHQRTYYLFNDFVKLFRSIKINNIIITDIYDVAGREEKNINEKVDSQMLVKKINRKNVEYMELNHAENFVKDNIKSGEVLVVMGAGDIYKFAEKF